MYRQIRPLQYFADRKFDRTFEIQIGAQPKFPSITSSHLTSISRLLFYASLAKVRCENGILKKCGSYLRNKFVSPKESFQVKGIETKEK